jgi:hypothetical protein
MLITHKWNNFADAFFVPARWEIITIGINEARSIYEQFHTPPSGAPPHSSNIMMSFVNSERER